MSALAEAEKKNASNRPEALTYNQYAAKHGLVTDYDVQGHIHGGLMAAHMPKSYHRRYQAKLLQLQNDRDAGVAAYKAALASGEVLPPRKLSGRELIEHNAAGHPDLAATQAARRMLERMDAHAALSKATGEA